MKIAILYICTGRYAQFFDTFYDSSERYMLNGMEKHYFVWTDNDQLTTAPNVTLIHHDCQGFPMDSLMRFDMFLSIADTLKAYDYTFFLNANMLFVAPVDEAVLPTSLAAVVHPGYYNKPAWRYPYERNKASKAYIPPRQGDYKYYMGSLNGGKTNDYLLLAETCSRNIHDDLERGFIAKYHDESHLNRYLRDHTCKPLSPAYAYIEGKQMPFEAKIVIRNKERFDSYYNKGRDRSMIGRLKKGIAILYDAIKWYL